MAANRLKPAERQDRNLYQPRYLRLPETLMHSSVKIARRLPQNPQVKYVLAQMKKSFHRAGTAGALTPQQEQDLFNQVAQQLLASPSVLQELQRMQQG